MATNKITTSDIRKNSFLLLSHYATFSLQDLIFEYLIRNKSARVTKINIPLPDLPFTKSIEVEKRTRGKLKSKKNIKTIIKPKSLAFILHFFQITLLLLFSRETYNVVIAQNSLLVLSAIVLKFFGKCKIVIFYSHGIDNSRFNKSIMNSLYKRLDYIAAKKSDFNWILGKSMEKVRLAQGIPPDKIFWVPSAINLAEITRKKNPSNRKLIFIGVLNDMNGVDLLPGIISYLSKKNPDIELDIIGDGEKREEVIKKAKLLGVSEKIHFLGIKNLEDYRANLTDYIIGLAPYRYSENNLLQRTDPMKPRLYIAAGLPVIATKGFYFTQEFVENKLGLGPSYDAKKYSDAIMSLLSNTKEYKKIRANCLSYSKKFDQDVIYTRVLSPVVLILRKK